jgi:hypothetical protein
MKAFEDQDDGQRINAVDAVKVKTESEVEGCDVDKVKTEPDDFEEEEFNKDMNDISVEVDDFKDANEALENQVEVCNDEKVKTEPDDFEDVDMKALEDHVEGQRINAFDAVKVKTESEFQTGF